MNARDGLQRIRERLEENGARTATLDLVDSFIDRASDPQFGSAQASLVRLTSLLAKSQPASNDVGIYDDLVQLQDALEAEAAKRAAAADAEFNKPIPKSKKYYKQLKEKEKSKR
jgi:hypothetical protein